MPCCDSCPYMPTCDELDSLDTINEMTTEGEAVYEDEAATSAAGHVDQREVAFRRWFDLRQGFEGMERDLKRITKKYEALRDEEAMARKELWAVIEGGGHVDPE